jgi:solute carrier family 6 GABA transporter-like protein 1
MVGSYYVVVIGWVVKAFVSSFYDDAPWGNPGLTGNDAVEYFNDSIIGMDTVSGPDNLPTRIVGENVGYTALVYLIIFISTAFGLKTTGRITYITMGLPFLIVFVFLGRSANLPGARDGVIA